MTVDLGRIFIANRLDSVSEFVFVLHTDAVEEHYHVYISFKKKVTENEVKKFFYNAKCYISEFKDETILCTLNYFTDGFRLPFESNFSISTEERQRFKSK